VGEKVQKGGATKHTPGHGPCVPQACPETGARFLVGGPLWAEPIHHQEWVAQLLGDLDSRKDDYARWEIEGRGGRGKPFVWGAGSLLAWRAWGRAGGRAAAAGLLLLGTSGEAPAVRQRNA
jgi:hypothetical protein